MNRDQKREDLKNSIIDSLSELMPDHARDGTQGSRLLGHIQLMASELSEMVYPKG